MRGSKAPLSPRVSLRGHRPLGDRAKSTFLRCLNRLEASSGEIFIQRGDADPHLSLNKMRENIGMVFQGSACSRT